MNRAIAAELFKLRTTRTSWAVILGSLGLVVIISLIASLAGEFEPGDAEAGKDLLQISGLVQIFALVLGILSVATEFRHGTVTPSLLAVPDRKRLVLAKLVTAIVAGALLGLVATGLCAALVLPILSSRDIPTDTDTGEVLRLIAGNGAACALYAGIGVGLGALIRKPGRRHHRRARVDLPDRAAADADPRLRGRDHEVVPQRGGDRARGNGELVRCARPGPRGPAARGVRRPVRRRGAVRPTRPRRQRLSLAKDAARAGRGAAAGGGSPAGRGPR